MQVLNRKQRCRGQSYPGNICNDIREQDVPRKRSCDDSSELNTNKPSKNPMIRSPIDEIINDGSTEDHTTPPCVPQKKPSVDVFGEKPLPPAVIVVEVFREKRPNTTWNTS